MGRRRTKTYKNIPNLTDRPAGRVEEKRKRDGGFWVFKVTIATFLTTALFTFLSDTTVSNSSIMVASLIVFFLILVSILFDIIGFVKSVHKACFYEY